MLKNLKISRAIRTKWQVIWKLTSMIKDCFKLTKHKVKEMANPIIYQAYQLKNQEKP